jgi:hypothetical protein
MFAAVSSVTVTVYDSKESVEVENEWVKVGVAAAGHTPPQNCGV